MTSALAAIIRRRAHASTTSCVTSSNAIASRAWEHQSASPRWRQRITVSTTSIPSPTATELFDLDTLELQLRHYVQQTLGLDEDAAVLSKEVLRRGELARGEAPNVIGRPERTARVVLSKLVSAGLLSSETPKGAVRLLFSTDSADVLFPRLLGAQLAGG